MIKIVIPLTPITKKNHQRIVQNKKTKIPFIIPSEQYKKYEKDCLFLIKSMKNHNNFEPINYRVNVKCLFFMPTHRKCDLTNLEESIDDILVRAEVLTDDNCTVIASHDGSRVYYDKEFPRTEIYIEEYIEEGGYDYV